MSESRSAERLTLTHIHAARERIHDKIHRTPVVTSATLDAQSGATLFFKCENLQKVGAFKARGAINAVFSMPNVQAMRGVATHSSGNHAAALARAAKLRGIAAHIVMPRNAPNAKQAAVARYGGRVVLCEPTLVAREVSAARVVAETGATLIHPFDNLDVMAGQGTAALEFLEEVPTLDVILCPVGGGGLLSGTAVAAKSIKPSITIVGVEPAGADDAARSVRAGCLIPVELPNSIADGLLTSLSKRTFAEIRCHVDDIVTVSDRAIVDAMRAIWQIMKIVIEPSAAVPYAAIIEGTLALKGKNVGIILSGGNLDLDSLPWHASRVRLPA